jgi:DNA-directed RNA polymerase specialized sigma24 family protein
MTDYNRIHPRHDAIDLRLIEWSRWVRVKPSAWFTQPMFRFAKSNSRQWEVDPPIHMEINTLAAHEIEKAVASLPEKHRTAIRWCYVFPYIQENAVRRELGATRSALEQLIIDSRDMLINILKNSVKGG